MSFFIVYNFAISKPVFQFHLGVWAPGVPGASVLALDPGAGGREAGEGGLGEDQVDLGAEDTGDQQTEDHGQGDEEHQEQYFILL